MKVSDILSVLLTARVSLAFILYHLLGVIYMTTREVANKRAEIMNIQARKLRELPANLKDIYEQYIMPVDTNIRLKDVILSDENKAKYALLLKEQYNSERLYKYGLCPINRVLLYGASGTGKTFSAKAICNELGYTMLYIDIAQALSDSDVSKHISDVFKLSNYLEYSVIMLDECDSIAWQRDTGNGDSGTIRRATNSIFQCLDQMSKKSVFFSATNMLHRLDFAFERRFNLKLEFQRPRINLKDSIQHFLHPGFTLIDDVDPTTCELVDKRALENKKLSYYELQVLVERSMKDAILNNTTAVHTSDIYIALSQQLNLRFRFDNDT